MPGKACSRIDFDDWAELALRDPAAFEARRARLIDEFIRQAPASRQQRLRCLQWRIDRARGLAPNPVAACVRLSQMMWDSLAGSGGLLDALDSLRRPPGQLPVPRRTAQVLPFRARRP